MSEPIASELRNFATDYDDQRRSRNGHEDVSEFGGQWGPFFHAFQQDQEINPKGLNFRSFFRGLRGDQLLDKIQEVREKANLPSQIPLRHWISLAESIVTTRDDETRSKYDGMFKRGLAQRELRRNLRQLNDYEDRDLTFLIHNQSGEKNRSIVEISSNAIDFSPLNSVVEVETDERGFTIRDYGKGMDPQTLIEELSIPFISGARDQNIASIGRFGMGFLTILRHLENYGDSVTVDTSFNGVGYQIKYTFKQNEISVEIGEQEEILEGTRVSLDVDNFDQDEAEELLQTHLQYKRGANILLNGEEVVRLEGLEFVDVGEDSLDRAGVGYEFAPRDNDNCEAVIAINGVKVVNQTIEGLNLPKRLILDLPYTANLSESRDDIVYDDRFIDSAKSIVTGVLGSGLSTQDKVQTCNALAELFSKLESNAFNSDESILLFLEESISEHLDGEDIIGLPAVDRWGNLDYDRAVLVNPKLKEALDSFTSTLEPIIGFRGQGMGGYVADFKEDAPVPVAIHEKTLVMDRKLYLELKDHPEFLTAYLSFIARDSGYIHIEKNNQMLQVETPEGKQGRLREEPYEETCLKTLLEPGRLFDDWAAERIFFSYDRLFADMERGSFDDRWKWVNGLSLGEDFLVAADEFIRGNRDSISFDETVIEEMISRHQATKTVSLPQATEEHAYTAIRSLLEHRDEIEEKLLQVREAMQFFLPQNIERYLEMDPDTIETAFAQDFLVAMEPLIPDNIDKVKNRMLRYLRFSNEYDDNSPEPTENDLAYDFEFVLSVVGSAFGGDSINETTPGEAISESVDSRTYDVVTRLKAIVDYRHSVQQLSDNERMVFDKLLSFRWGGGLSSPDDLLRYSRSWSDKVRVLEDNPAIMDGVVRMAQVLDEEFVTQVVDTMVNDPRIIPSDMYLLMAFVTDPHLTYHHAIYGRWISGGDDEKTEYTPVALGRYDTGMEAMRHYFNEEGNKDFSWRYRYEDEISTLDEYDKAMSRNLEIARSGMLNLVDKYQKIYQLPEVTAIFETRGLDVDKAFHEAFKVGDSSRYGQFYSFEAQDAMLHAEGTFAPLSQVKLETIQQTIQERFDPNFMDRSQMQGFSLYLRRVMCMTHLSDEDFTYLQPWLAFEGLRFSHEYSILREELYNPKIIDTLLSQRHSLEAEGLDQVLDMWSEIATSFNGKEFIRRKTIDEKVELFSRVVEIVQDIRQRPKFLQSHVFEGIKKLSKSGKAGYDNFSLFYQPEAELSQIPGILHPYILYFRHGDRSTLDETQVLAATEKGDYDVLLSDVMHFKRAQSGRFRKALDSPEDFAMRAEENSLDINKFIYYRELLHSIQHLPANDSYLFLRELIQNAYDVSREQGGHHQINIDNFKDGDLNVVQIRDTVGMNFETILSKLLIPNVSSKINPENLGKFGVGFMSIFKDAQKVELRTGNGQQQTVAVITPVYTDGGQLIDLNVSYSIQDSTETGSVIRKYFRSPNPSLESAKIQASTIKYGSYLDPDQVEVSYGDEQINSYKPILSQSSNPQLGQVQILDGAEVTLHQGRFYVNELPDYVAELIPDQIRSIILKHGFVLNVDPQVGLTRSRKDFANKQEVTQILADMLPGMAIEATVAKFADGQFDLQMIPYDYFWSQDVALESWRSIIDEQTIEDADKFNQGDQDIDWSRYQQPEPFLELLTLIKGIEIDGEKRSLQEINDMRKQGYEFELDELPSRIKELLTQSKQRDESNIQRRRQFEQRQEAEVPLRIYNQDLETKLKEVSDAHLAFLEVVDAMSDIDNIRHGYFNSPHAAIAFAVLGHQIKAWNLLYNHRHVEELARFLQGGEMTESDIYRFMSQIADTSTHEDTHIILDTAHWGQHHTKAFWEEQEKVWSGLIKNHQQIISSALERINNYEGKCLPREEIAQILAA